MRLTLRTLLAYLDDTLTPAEARLIGEKVAESETAQNLMAKIKLVTRRRRLMTPPSTGPGARLDANVVAAYLDNNLNPDEVTELEEKCIESDAHLADVSACHQILTLVVGQPILVPPTALQRMYSLNRGPESLPRRKAPAPAVGRGSHHDIDIQPDESDEALLLGLPLYREGGLMRWLAPLATALLLAAATVAVWMALRYSTPRVPSFPASSGAELTLATPGNRLPTEPETEMPKADFSFEKLKEESAKSAPGPDTSANKPAAELHMPAVAAADAGVKPPVDSPDKSKPNSVPEKIKPKMDSEKPPTPAESKKEATKDRIVLGYANLSAPAALVQRGDAKEPWQLLANKKEVYSNDTLISLPGCKSDLTLSSGVRLSMWGILPELSRTQTHVLESKVVLNASKSFDLDFKLERGRVVIEQRKPDGPALVRMRFSDQVWDLTIPDTSTAVVAEYYGEVQPLGQDLLSSEPGTYANLLVIKGAIKLSAGQKEYALTSPCMFDWDSTFGMQDKPRALPRPPDWWTNREPPRGNAAAATRSALSALCARFTGKSGLEIVLAEAFTDSNINNRVLALRCRAALDEIPPLLEALADDRHAEMRGHAIEELQHLLGFNAKFDKAILDALHGNYTDDQAKTVVHLLHPLSVEQWSDSILRQKILTFLLSDKLAIRQLTHALLLTLVPEGKSIAYDPAGDTLQRDRAYDDWKQLVSRMKPPAKKS
jgi:hypothetical protein